MLALLRRHLSLAFQVEIGYSELPMPLIFDGDGLPEEVRLVHDETSSCRVDEGHAPVEIDIVGETGADTHLLKGRHHPRRRGCLVVGL